MGSVTEDRNGAMDFSMLGPVTSLAAGSHNLHLLQCSE
jgi:hypothetical protein